MLYFAATDNEHGSELWRSDGTNAGTQMVIDLNPGLNPGIDEYYPGALVEFQEYPSTSPATMVFTARAVEERRHRSRHRIGQGHLSRGDVSGPYSSVPRNYIDVDGTLFFVPSGPGYRDELWKSDGTEAGTLLVNDYSPRVLGAVPV